MFFLFTMIICGFSVAQTVQPEVAIKENNIVGIGLNDNGRENIPILFSGTNPVPDNMALWVLPSTGGTSTNTRAPGNTYRYQRTEYLITPAEMSASGFPSGATVDGIGWLVGVAGVGTQTGLLKIWMKNTTNTTYSLGTNWTVSGFTRVDSTVNWTVPIASGSYTVTFTGGSTFTYTGSGLYIAWEFSNPSGALGTTAVTHLCNTNANLLYGNRSNTSLPTGLTLSNYRPATTFLNNYYTDVLQVTNIYVQEKCPVPYGVPTNPTARVYNVSGSAQTFTITMTIKDQALNNIRYTDTKTVTSLAAGTGQVVSFTPWNAINQENVNVTVTVPTASGESFISNNTMTIPMNINSNLFGYCYSLNPSSGYGFTYNGSGGCFLSKFHMNGAGSVPSVNLFIYNYSTNPGNTIFAVVLNSSGTIVAQSANLVISTSDLGTNKNFTFPTIPVFTDQDFYVGLAQPPGGTSQWYPMGVMSETPYRASTFYYISGTAGGTPIIHGSDYKFMIEANVGSPNLYKTLNVKLYLEGLYNASVLGTMNKAQDENGDHFPSNTADQVTVELHSSSNYWTIIYSTGLVNLSTGGNISVTTVPAVYSDSYYITIRHRNSIETVSALPVSFSGTTISYDFSNAASKAYGNNQKNEGNGYFSIWGGDINQDGVVDSSDENSVDMKAQAFAVGYLQEDVNGDGLIDGSDHMLIFNNTIQTIFAWTP
jgi:hypothetical protein